MLILWLFRLKKGFHHVEYFLFLKGLRVFKQSFFVYATKSKKHKITAQSIILEKMG